MSLKQGSDAILNQKLAYQAYNRLKNHFIKTTNPGDLQDGMIWFDSANQTWFGKRTAGLFDFTLIPPLFPEGMIIPWSGGYFTDGANGGYTRVLGATNDAAGINALLNGQGWYVCNGAALNTPLSTIYNGAGRYLPNLTDDRFLMGDNLIGVVGGSNSSAHTHGVGSFVNAAENAHYHQFNAVGITIGAEAAHTHAVGSFVNAAEATHTHGNGTLAIDAAAAHSHGAGSYGADSAGDHVHSVDPPNTTTSAASAGDCSSGSYMHTLTLASHTHDVNIAAFDSASAGAHPHSVSGTSGSGGGHGHTISGAIGAGSSHNHAISGTSAAGSSHTHAPSGIVDTGAGNAHNHAISGTSAAGSSHTHAPSGIVDTGAGNAHNHAISGTSGAASATENRPNFLGVMYLQYVLAA